MIVYTITGKALTLKEPSIGSGAEGIIYEISGYPGRVAKIYKNAEEARKREQKIIQMTEIAKQDAFQRENLLQDIAWPLAPLFNSAHKFVGFGMKRIPDFRELLELYVYPSIKGKEVSIRNRVKCLISLCDIIDRFHKTGQVFGDFNPNNIKIRPDWSVCFVDADSCQVYSAGKEYRCTVCLPGYAAPEVVRACRGTTYEKCPGRTFTQESDAFALAVHIFRMLMNGYHPFTEGSWNIRKGSVPAPVSLDERVARRQTLFFNSVPGYTIPCAVPDLNSLPSYLTDLFRRAFVEGDSNPKNRPNASEWKRVLVKFMGEIVNCRRNSFHSFWTGNTSCPYCEADNRYANRIKSVLGKRQNPPKMNSAVAVSSRPKPVRSNLYTAVNNVSVSSAVSGKAAVSSNPAGTAAGKKGMNFKKKLALLACLFVFIIPEILAVFLSLYASRKTEVISTPRIETDGSFVQTSWDCIWFGNYWQDTDSNQDGKVDQADRKEPIKWRVLSYNEKTGEALLLADRNLEIMRYNEYKEDTTWENCTLRSFLNSLGCWENQDRIDYTRTGFSRNAFSWLERLVIHRSSLDNPSNPIFKSRGGTETIDKVFCLSLEEALNTSYGFRETQIRSSEEQWTWPDKTRVAYNTAYVSAKPGFHSESAGSELRWWLRSPAYTSSHAAHTDNDGTVNYTGMYVTHTDAAVRPAIRLNLKSTALLWEYAGTVTVGVDS